MYVLNIVSLISSLLLQIREISWLDQKPLFCTRDSFISEKAMKEEELYDDKCENVKVN